MTEEVMQAVCRGWEVMPGFVPGGGRMLSHCHGLLFSRRVKSTGIRVRAASTSEWILVWDLWVG